MTIEELAYKFAPMVYLHSKEKAFPSSTYFMLKYCTLRPIGLIEEETDPENDPVFALAEKENEHGRKYFTGMATEKPSYLYLDPNRKDPDIDVVKAGEPLVDNACITECYYNARIRRKDAIINYWFFYPDNPYGFLGIGKHIGDWEHIRIYIKNYAQEDHEAVWAYYDAHGKEMGRIYPWEELEIVPDTHHPIVYSARKSHANYNRAKVYPRSVVFLIDRTNRGYEWKTYNNLTQIFDPPDPTPGHEWVSIEGGWGRKSAPTGPATRHYFKYPLADLDPIPGLWPWDETGKQVAFLDEEDEEDVGNVVV